MRDQLLGRSRGITAAIGIGHVEREVVQELLDQRRNRRIIRIGAVHGRDRSGRRAFEIRVDVFDVWIESDRREDPAGNGIEEGLGQVPVFPVGNEFRVVRLHDGPDGLVGYFRCKPAMEVFNDLIDDVLVEIEAFGRVGLQSRPVPFLKTLFGAPGDLPETNLIGNESVQDQPGGIWSAVGHSDP